ncbi:hypothetical protein H2204_001120 [Knufia peltigerae]|uniref:Laccase n=1 Tax=Knufia peltigerae TaxID=1002370 RepID=A0AA38YF98_9EURO|nr:hypothetical protein H2204_001120 [Knufia peltigerae]
MEYDDSEGLSRRNSTYTYKASNESARLPLNDEARVAEIDQFPPDSEEQGAGQGSTDEDSHGYQQSTSSNKIETKPLLMLAILIFVSVFVYLGYGPTGNLSTRTKEFIAHERTSDGLAIPCHPEEHVYRESRILSYNFTITSAIRDPDGVKKHVYLVNGAFPGPIIECRTGDFLFVHVTNALDNEGLAIHWHGLEMKSANHMDGAVGFTQSSIPAGDTFTYEFQVNEEFSGTFWWHAHSQLQRGDGLYGGFIVHQPIASQEEKLHSESLLLIGDWYHQNAQDLLTWFTSVIAIGNEPVPDSLLINGKGHFNCSMAIPARPVDCRPVKSTDSLPILNRDSKEGKIRLRIVNVGSLAGFTLQFKGAKVVPLSMDGDNIIGDNGRYNSVGTLYPGERIDLLLEWTMTSILSPKIKIQLDPENFKLPNPALNPNQEFPLLRSRAVSRIHRPMARSETHEHVYTEHHDDEPIHFDLESATGKMDDEAAFKLPEPSQGPIVIYTKTEKLALNSYHPKSYINRTSWSPQTGSATGPRQPLISLPRHHWNSNQLVPYIPLPQKPKSNDPSSGNYSAGTCIDIIINNLDDGAHPFHLHGHSFWVLRSHRAEDRGWGSFNPYSTTLSSSDHSSHFHLNTRNPIRRDTVSVPRRGHVVIRLWTDNEGIWMLHCHILVHQASGMAMGLQIGGDIENKGPRR